MESEKKIDMTQEHIQAALGFALDKNIPLTREMLIMVDNAYKSVANKSMEEKVTDIITELQTNLNYLYTSQIVKEVNVKMFEMQKELERYTGTFEDFLKFIKYTK